MDRHIPRIIDMYRKKRDIMLEALDKYFPEGCRWTHPHGGMFLWATLPEHIDTKEMFNDALKEKVAYVHGRAFYTEGLSMWTGEVQMRCASISRIHPMTA